MNCEETKRLLISATPLLRGTAEQQAFEQHLLTCSACRALERDLEEVRRAVVSLPQGVAIPSAQGEWQILRTRINASAKDPQRIFRIDRAGWIAAPFAVAAALAVAAIFQTPESTDLDHRIASAKVDFVEAGRATDSTFVFVDQASGWTVIWTSAADTSEEKI